MAVGLGVCFYVAQSALAQGPVDLGLDAAKETGLASTDIRLIVARVIRAALGLLGIAALLLVIYGGYMYMTAGGNEDRVMQAKKILLNAGIGLVIIMSSFGIVSFVMSKLVDAINGSGSVTGLEDGGGAADDGGSGSFGRPFYVVALPQASDVCIRNVNPQIVFNKEVNLETTVGAITLTEKSTGEAAPGSWAYGQDKKSIVFKPDGSCSPSVGSDCLKASTEYTIAFTNPTNIKTLSQIPEQSLNCRVRAGCSSVTFKSGEGIDRLPPTVTITYPPADHVVSAGATVPVRLTYQDDSGVQNITLSHAGEVVDSRSFSGCKQTDTVSMNWPLESDLTGQQSILVRATDWAGMNGEAARSVTVQPAHCFNEILETELGETELGPPECGGVCGVCSGGACSANSQCASGSCLNGVCSNIMKIVGFTPTSGATGTLVSIVGKYFGATPGKVYFSNKENPVVTKPADWIEAKLAACGGNTIAWSSGQILVDVPDGVANFSHLKVETAGTRPVVDSTVNHPELGKFEVTGLVRPRLCAISPDKGQAGDPVALTGQRFQELTTANDHVVFGILNASIVRGENNALAWVDDHIVATVPGTEGRVGVKVVKDNVESNSVQFYIESGDDGSGPTISELTPTTGAEGEYITITGHNFGTKLGAVWFKSTPDSSAIIGDFDFPSDCANSVWTDSKIIVKFPKDILGNKGSIGTTYFVQVNTSDKNTSNIDQSKIFTLRAGDPKPGICKISPTSGPIPYPEGERVTLAGEYFLSGDNKPSSVYFWESGATTTESVLGREPVPTANIVISANTVEVVPPNNTISGPVSVVRSADNEISNPAQFNVFDCRSDGKSCSASQHCCLNGNEAGICKPMGEFCSGQLLTAGYVWRFSTRDIPPVPHVLERCVDSVGAGEALPLPSPSPSIQWDKSEEGAHHNVCRNALVIVEFTTNINRTSVNPTSLIVNKCGTVTDGICNNPRKVGVLDTSYKIESATGDHSYLQITPTGTWKDGKWSETWDDNSWYQVVLSNKIKSVSAGANNTGISLSADKPCGGDSAYCFTFKAGQTDCKLKDVIVTPYLYVTKLLESPMKKLVAGVISNVNYRGLGLSDQRCILMNDSGVNWSWSASDTDYADINGTVTRQEVQVDAKANTVGTGLADDAVNITAQAVLGALTKVGQSPLTIDLSNPAVVDYWPNCLEACTNAEVGVKFNVSMSEKNLNDAKTKGSVKLYKCLDENCLTTSTVDHFENADIFLDPASSGTVLKIANSRESSIELATNTLYKVVISTASSSKSNPAVLWSRAKIDDAASMGKPMNQEFSWRFRTKQNACQISRVDVLPKEFQARMVGDRSIFAAQPYSAPDACSASGQKLNAWKNSWAWSSSVPLVATINTFSTKGSNNFCTASCIKKGSTVPSEDGVGVIPACGNGVVEAGEDCDGPNKAGNCGLNCLFIQKTNTGSSVVPDAGQVNASICGNGMIGAGEDCDLGIAASATVTTSAYNCSEKCLHTGTRLSLQWCFDHRTDHGGFDTTPLSPTSSAAYTSACAAAFSQCGDGITTDDEDVGCDLGDGNVDPKCTSYCLANTKDSGDVACVGTDGKIIEGCTATGQHNGSSLNYTTPSVCGDETVGIGEDASCEENFTVTRTIGLVNPWVMATAVGSGRLLANPPRQETDISASTPIAGGRVAAGSGKFTIMCGYRTDAECQAVMGSNNPNVEFGVGSDSCCYARPNLVTTYPAGFGNNICPNTAIKAVFDGVIEQKSLATVVVDEGVALGVLNGTTTVNSNILIARAYNASENCAPNTEDVSELFYSASVASTLASESYIEPFVTIALAVRTLPTIQPIKIPPPRIAPQVRLPSLQRLTWCAGLDKGSATVVRDPINTSTSYIKVALLQPLKFSTKYAIIIKKDVRDNRGVSVATDALYWRFDTAAKICELDAVTITPDNWLFTKAYATTTLMAEAHTRDATGDIIQPISGYSWEYDWKPNNNPVVAVEATTSSENVIAANNTQGELDVRATAVITENTYTSSTGNVAFGTSHITVALCENPWPPKDLLINKSHKVIFPYEDVRNNNDGYNTASKTFSGLSTDGNYFNFSTFYCADNGSSGTFDDLPYLQPAVQTSTSALRAEVGSCETTGDFCKEDNDCDGTYVTGRDLKCLKNETLKRFIFTNANNSDAIGIQVFANNLHLTAEEWYSQDKSRGGQGFVGNMVNKIVSGYPAVSDNNNIYIDALNYNKSAESLYSNIYLFSINSNAKPETRQVFDQLIKNLKFNKNITYNDGYCGPTIDNPSFEKKCSTDLDCMSGEVCASQVEKLKRNYSRLRDLKTIDTALIAYAAKNSGKFPAVAAGSYLPGQSLSVWDWAGIANDLGKSLPKDPINKLGRAGTCLANKNKFCTVDSDCKTSSTDTDTCLLHDPVTNWSTADRRFSFACAPASFAYRYKFNTSTGFAVAANFEDTQLIIANWNNNNNAFIPSYNFSDSSRYVFGGLVGAATNGICETSEEISTINQGTCGDGQINTAQGEQCDPAGSVKFNRDSCRIDGTIIAGREGPTKVTCQSDCRWGTPEPASCIDPNKCGNGRIDSGERCDDGAQNGKWNKCTINCTWPPANPPGYCGDDVLQEDNEVCDTGRLDKNCKDVETCGTKSHEECNKKLCFADGLSWKRGLQPRSLRCSLVSDCGLYMEDNFQKALQPWYIPKIELSNVTPNPDDVVIKKEILKQQVQFKNKNITCNVSTREYNCTLDLEYDFLPCSYKNHLDVSFNVENDCVNGICQGKIKNISGQKICPFDDTFKSYTVGEYAVSFKRNESLKCEPIPLASCSAGDIITVSERKCEIKEECTNTIVRTGQPTYGMSKKDSCSWDCQKYGPYCGDGIVQVEHGEECDGDKKCQENGYDGIKDCSDICKYSDPNALDENPWPCVIPERTSATLAAGSCGNKVVDPGEACDLGVEKNGIQCSAAYGQSCQYCAEDCKSSQNIRANEFCGNGIIEKNENFERDGEVIYAKLVNSTTTVNRKNDEHNGFRVLSCDEEKAPTHAILDFLSNPYKLIYYYYRLKGTKIATDNCQSVIINETNLPTCSICGIDEANGVEVSGKILNVLESAGTVYAKDPLYSSYINTHVYNFIQAPMLSHFMRQWVWGGNVTLLVGDKSENDVVSSTAVAFNKDDNRYLSETTTYKLGIYSTSTDGFTWSEAKLSADPQCYNGESPSYKLNINGSAKSIENFRVVKNPVPWQYDLVLSPAITSTRPNDLRIVVSWSGHYDFTTGLAKPLFTQPLQSLSVERRVLGYEYYETTETVDGVIKTKYSDSEGSYNVWYHGVSTTENGLSAESFTIDTSIMTTDTYHVYVASTGDDYIKNLVSSAPLRVDVYLPDATAAFYHFSRPSKTFYLRNADDSTANQKAKYWHVFNIIKGGDRTAMTEKIGPAQYIDPVTGSTINYENGRIVTAPSEMR